MSLCTVLNSVLPAVPLSEIEKQNVSTRKINFSHRLFTFYRDRHWRGLAFKGGIKRSLRFNSNES